MNQTPDSSILKGVNAKLLRTGAGAQSKISASVRQGEVTLSGTLPHEIQRRPIVKAATSVAGVKRVVDRMVVVERKRQ